ncbi:MAG: phage major capsid protein [Dichotomicrobium sp.]
MKRAYSLLEIKQVDEDRRVITGIATTPTPDRLGDIVEPDGAEFSLPIPLLWQHEHDQPIGHVTDAKVTEDGIEVVAKLERIDEPGTLKDRLDEAWQSIRSGLVRGLSIGFRAVETANIEDSFSLRFIKWMWLELSAVTIPANAEATIATVKSIDGELWAASGRKSETGTSPGASGSRVVKMFKPEDLKMSKKKTLAEQISAFEATRQAKSARMVEIMEAAGEEGVTLDDAQQEEYDGLADEVKSIDDHLKRLNALNEANKKSAIPANGDNPASGAASRARVQVGVKGPKLEPGIGFTRIAKVKALAKLDGDNVRDVARELYGEDSPVYGHFTKAAVEAGNTVDSVWAGALVGDETSVFADFVEYLRPMTILGRFGTNGIPSLRRVPFRTALVGQDSGGSGYWVGEGKAKPLTKFDFSRRTLDPLKVANIAVTTEELLRDSSPSAEMIVRDQLAAALRERMDRDFIDPTKSEVSGVSPAAITNGVTALNSTGTDADAVRQDVRNLFNAFIEANNAPTNGVFIMNATTALTLSLMVNALGQPEFDGITMNGGTFFGLPVITSEFVPVEHTSPSDTNYVILVNASDIYFADEGGVAIDMSREASLEMNDSPTHGSAQTDSPAGSAGASLVSLWQTNSVGFRAERTLNWLRRRDEAVQVLGEVAWSLS